jgi:hypothetical protein
MVRGLPLAVALTLAVAVAAAVLLQVFILLTGFSAPLQLVRVHRDIRTDKVVLELAHLFSVQRPVAAVAVVMVALPAAVLMA